VSLQEEEKRQRETRGRPEGVMPCDVRGKDWMDWNDAKVPAATRSSSEKERGWADTPWSWTPGLQNCESASLVLYHLVQRRQWHLLQYYCLESPMDRGAWQAAVHGVAKSRTRLSDFTFTFPFHALEKEMATHSSVLACRIPGTGEPGGLPSMGSHRVGHD